MTRLFVLVFALAMLGCGVAADDEEQQVKFAFLHFTGENVAFEVDGNAVFEKILTTDDHTVGLSHLESLTVREDSTIKWTVDGRVFEQQLDISPIIGVVFITLGQPLVEAFEGNELLLD